MADLQKAGVITKDALIMKAGDLQILPTVARKVLELVASEMSSAADLKNIIEKDQTITTRILKIANSAFYGLRREVTNLQQAIVILGFRSIKNLVVAATTRSLYKRFGITEQMLWDHSVGAAIAGKVITKKMNLDFQETAFVGGLMHDVGKVVMNNESGKTFVQVMMKIYNDGLDAVKAEQEIYGYTHEEIGSGVLEKWKLPKLLVSVIGCHHRWETDLGLKISEPDVEKSVAAVNVADYVCKFHGIGYRQPKPDIDFGTLKGIATLKISKDSIPAILEEVKKTYETEKAVFQ